MRAPDRRILSELHLRLLHLVAAVQESYHAPNLRLEGGTALAAFHLGHRESEDLDFFADPGLNAAELGRRVSERAAGEGLLIENAGPSSQGFVRLIARGRESPGPWVWCREM